MLIKSILFTFLLLSILPFLVVSESYGIEFTVNPDRIEITAIPDWVDQNFRWYGEGAIAQSELVNAIKYLIDEEIMIIDRPDASSGDSLQSDLAEKGIIVIESMPSDVAAKGIIVIDSIPDQRAVDFSLRGELEAKGIIVVESMPSDSLRGDLEAKGIIVVESMPSDSLRGDLEAKGIIIVETMPSDVAEKGIIIVGGSPSDLAAKGIIITGTMPGTTAAGGEGEIIIVGNFATRSEFASKTIDNILTNGGTESLWEEGITSFSKQGLRESVIPELAGIVVLCNNEIDKKTQSINAELKILEHWLDIISKKQQSESYDADDIRKSDTIDPNVQADLDFITGKLASIDQQIKALDTGVGVLEEKLSSFGDDAQLANMDLQNSLQKMQQIIQSISNTSKMVHDTQMSIIRNMR